MVPKIAVPTLTDSGIGFLTFRFGAYPFWAKFYRGIIFLSQAFRVIQEKRLTPAYSFHLINAQNRPIGISDGDIRYPAIQGELERLSPLIVFLEDRRFFRHLGIDVRAIVRAFLANLRFFKIVQGGSTITQQLVRNTLLVPERSILRKLFEVLLAIKIERHFTKQEILDLYCNHVYLGKGIRGFPAAAKIVFRRKLSSLNDTQICGLLGLLRTPARTFPENDSTSFLARQIKITKILKVRNIQIAHPDRILNPINVANHRCPRFTHIVKSELVRLTGDTPDNIRRVGLTIDSSVQAALRNTLREITKLKEVKSAAGVILSIATANVLAEVACEDGKDSHFSPTYFGSLQPGSTFKTFALLSALQQGISLDQPLLSAPFTSSFYRATGNKPWRVRNYANVYRGVISLDDAFKYSDNTAFAMLVEMMDTDPLFKLYKNFGLCESSKVSPAIVLGGHEGGVSLLSLVAAYRAIANGSSYIHPRILKYIEFSDGSFFSFHRSQETQLVREYKAIRDLQLALLNAGPYVGGTKQAGKTGSTRTGSLLASYNDKIATAIWIGYKKPIAEGDPKAVGAVSAFHRFMNRLRRGGPDLLSI